MQHKLSTDSTKFPENMIQNLNLDLAWFINITPSIRHMSVMEEVIKPRQTLSILTRAKAGSCLKIGQGDPSPSRAV